MSRGSSSQYVQAIASVSPELDFCCDVSVGSSIHYFLLYCPAQRNHKWKITLFTISRICIQTDLITESPPQLDRPLHNNTRYRSDRYRSLKATTNSSGCNRQFSTHSLDSDNLYSFIVSILSTSWNQISQTHSLWLFRNISWLFY
jgi:hypothetical protein